MLLINKRIFENFLYRFDGPSKMLLFYFSFVDFDHFLTAFAKNLMKRPPIFIIDIKISYKLLLSQKDLRSRNFWQWNDGPLNIFKNLHGNAFPLFVFIKRKYHSIVPFNDIKCVATICFMKIEALWTVFFEIMGRQTWCLIFLGFLLLVVFTAFLPRTLSTNCHFLIWIFKIHFKIYYFAKF